ncbi:MAG: hypothetical protein GY913_02940 [Proteobacteria bacterium]|nr:hypothetical protein [Pseudomonadota bacterium]MCP4915855.1 hypothetical protein [Pseudomonadota bacterium]
MILSVLACSLLDAPEPAAREAFYALRDGNLESFEARVDMDAVVPQAFEGCTRITLLEDWGERAAAPNQGLRELGRTLGRGLLNSAVESAGPELVADARAGFGSKPISELCPAIQPGDVLRASFDVNGNLATGQLPIVAWGVETHVDAAMTKNDQGWHIVGLDFDKAIAEIKTGLEQPTP